MCKGLDEVLEEEREEETDIIKGVTSEERAMKEAGHKLSDFE